MPISISEAGDLAVSGKDPSTLGELLIAGKKVPPDATTLLMQDHAEVRALFRQYETETDDVTKAVLATEISVALTVHAQIEEDVFYPAAGAALEDDDLVNEAVDEHNEMKTKIAEIVRSAAAAKSLDTTVTELMRIVEHHVMEEETEMFPDLRQSNVDLIELGRKLAAQRVTALMAIRKVS